MESEYYGGDQSGSGAGASPPGRDVRGAEPCEGGCGERSPASVRPLLRLLGLVVVSRSGGGAVRGVPLGGRSKGVRAAGSGPSAPALGSGSEGPCGGIGGAGSAGLIGLAAALLLFQCFN